MSKSTAQEDASMIRRWRNLIALGLVIVGLITQEITWLLAALVIKPTTVDAIVHDVEETDWWKKLDQR